MATIQTDINAGFQACVRLYNAKQYQDAITKSDQLLALQPDNVDVKYVKALCLMDTGNLNPAEQLFDECLAACPSSDQLYASMATLYEKQGRIADAVVFYQKSIQLNPASIHAINNLGNIYNNIGENKLALECFNKMLKLGHKEYYIYNNIALVYKKIGLLKEAESAIQQCLQLNPQTHQPYHNAALIYAAMGHKQNSIAYYDAAFKLNPNDTQITAEYRDMCTNVCDWDKYDLLEKHMQELIKAGGKPEVISPMSDIQKNINLASNLKHAIAHTSENVKNILKTNQPFTHNRKLKAAGEKIRIGYISSDIKDHPVAHLMRGVFRNHNKEQFEVYLYSSSGDDNSGYKEAIKSYVDCFVDIKNSGNLEVANRIYSDKIDVLIDLNGHTGLSRLEALALKPAPVQIQYIGYIGSMGADFIDYIITDKIVTPPEHQQYYTEKFLYMPNCYQANDDMLEVSSEDMQRKEHNLPQDAFVFCSFNQTYKIEPVMFKCWMNILKRVPESVLWLYKGSIYISDNLAKENLLKKAAEYGVEPGRIIFADGMPTERYLKRISLADLALDTRVYNGGTITSQTLWAGVPVLTLEGGHFASRMATSILTAVGMEELITRTLQEYEDLAVKIATTKGQARKLKNKLAKNRQTYPLFDTVKFTRDMEGLYREVCHPKIESRI